MAGILACSCSPKARPTGQGTTKVRVLLLPYLTSAPLFIAQEEGFFAEQGLEVEFMQMNRSGEAIPLLVQGELDVLPGSLEVGFFNAIARGARMKIVADKGRIAAGGCPDVALLARPDVAERGRAAISPKGKRLRVASSPASPFEYVMERALRHAGFAPEEIELVDVIASVRPEALDRGNLDACLSGEPWMTRLVRGGHAVVWVPAHAVLPDFQFGFITFGPSLLDERPETGRRFMVAYLQGVRQFNRGKTERNLEIIGRNTRLERDLLEQMCWAPFERDGRANIQSMIDFQNWAVARGYLDRAAVQEELWEPAFVEYANRELNRARN